MRRLIAAIAALALSFGIFASSERASAQSTNPQTRLVFAYYFLATSTYGFTVDDYKKDIQDAQALGIDGFAVAAGSWSYNPSTYPVWAAAMFAAAQAAALNSDGTKFKLFFSAEVGGGASGITTADVQSMLNSTFTGTPPVSGTGVSSTNYYWYAGKPMLTTSSGQLGQDDATGNSAAGQAFWASVFSGGVQASFYPAFITRRPTGGRVNTDNPTYAQISSDYNTWWKDMVGGLCYFTTDGLAINPDGSNGDMIASEEAYATLMGQNSRLYLAGLSSYYAHAPNDPYIVADERYGGEGIAAQWNSIINVQKPQWVILYTWNDLGETYMSSADMTWANSFYVQYPMLYSHVGMAQLNAYFISWFKNNTQPAVTNDKLFYFYRTQPAAAVPPGNTITTAFYDLIDCIFITTILGEPATVQVTSGGNVTSVPVASGMVHTRVSFTPGAQNIQLIRGGTTLINLTGDTILSTISVFNQNPTTGFATSGSTTSSSATSGSGTSTVSASPTPPTVTFTSPGNGAVYKANGAVNITASASDPNGVASITIGGDSRSLMTCTNATSCSATWQGKQITRGTHTISATAINRLGYSAKTSITILELH
jgi:glucan endo-1,3-alpha-glucosidase